MNQSYASACHIRGNPFITVFFPNDKSSDENFLLEMKYANDLLRFS